MEYVPFQDLLRQVRRREPEAIKRWIDLFEPLIHFQASVGSRAPRLRRWRDSADNVQSTFLMCFKEDWPAKFVDQPFERAVAFFRTAASRNLLRHLRRLDAAPAGRLDSKVEIACDKQRASDQAVADDEWEKRILAAIRTECRDDEQWAMVQRLLEGEGYTAVAEQRGVNESTVRMAFQRVLWRARTSLLGLR